MKTAKRHPDVTYQYMVDLAKVEDCTVSALALSLYRMEYDYCLTHSDLCDIARRLPSWEVEEVTSAMMHHVVEDTTMDRKNRTIYERMKQEAFETGTTLADIAISCYWYGNEYVLTQADMEDVARILSESRQSQTVNEIISAMRKHIVD